MLEKTRIHRAMLQLDFGEGFSAKDLAVSTAAATSTIRKTIERAAEQRLIEVRGTRPAPGLGGPEKLYRLLPAGRDQVEAETSSIYAKLLGPAHTPSDVDLSTEALEASLEILQALRQPVPDRSALLDRLAVVAAELDEAARDQSETGRKAALLRQVVRVAEGNAERLAEFDQPALRDLCTALLDQVAKASTPSPLDVLPQFLPALRRDAATQTSDVAAADALVCRVLVDLCASNLTGKDIPRLAELARSLLKELSSGKPGPDRDLLAQLQEVKNECLKIGVLLAGGEPSILTDITGGLYQLKRQNTAARLLETTSTSGETVAHRLNNGNATVGSQLGALRSLDAFDAAHSAIN